MSIAHAATRSPLLSAHFLGRVDFDVALRLQRRLVYEAGEGITGNVTLLFCEHQQLITVGRAGSRAHIRVSEEELRHRHVAVRFVTRGGGCIVHGPGQLAVYPIVSLRQRGWKALEFRRRFLLGLRDALADLGITTEARSTSEALWGRTGPLAAIGLAVKHGVAFHGAFINVEIERGLTGYVDSVAAGDELRPMSSLVAERGRPVRMTSVRAALVSRLADALECPRQNVQTGHPHLALANAS
jgi:lipoyl(octanoyl) transferase